MSQLVMLLNNRPRAPPKRKACVVCSNVRVGQAMGCSCCCADHQRCMAVTSWMQEFLEEMQVRTCAVQHCASRAGYVAAAAVALTQSLTLAHVAILHQVVY
jgi:hypothetical protein